MQISQSQRLKFQHIYYLLAAFDVLMLTASLGLNHQNLSLFRETVVQNQVFVEEMADLEELSKLAGEVNAPGNNVFDSKAPGEERRNLESALQLYRADLAKVARISELSAGLERLSSSMDEMVAEADRIFSAFERGDPRYAGSRMATMDQKYAGVNQVLRELRTQLSVRQSQLLQGQHRTSNQIARAELLIGILILVVVAAVTLYGHRLGKLIVDKDTTIHNQEFQILDSQNLTNLGAMSSAIIHEIQNPLTIITGRLGQIQSAIKGAEAVSPDAPMIDVRAARLIEVTDSVSKMLDRIGVIIRSVRSMSHSQSNETVFEEIPFAALVQETLALAQLKAKQSDVRIVLKEVPNLKLKCQPVQISQVLLNLINNACDAVGGKPGAWVQLYFMATEEVLQVAVTDSGSGIPVETAKRLMSPFFTTKERGKGTGLGLSICKKIVESHGGTLRYNPEFPNTQFVFVVPTTARPKVAVEEPEVKAA